MEQLILLRLLVHSRYIRAAEKDMEHYNSNKNLKS